MVFYPGIKSNEELIKDSVTLSLSNCSMLDCIHKLSVGLDLKICSCLKLCKPVLLEDVL